MSDDNNDGLIRPNEVVAGYLARAMKAHEHLGKTWEYWVSIGHAIWKFKQQLDAAISPNEAGQRPEDTQRHRDSMGEFLRVNRFHENDPEGFTKAVRMNLMHIMERLPEIEAFRKKYAEDYGQKKLHKLNNPSAVWNKFCGPKKEGQKPGLKASIAKLQEEIDDLKKENERLENALATKDWSVDIQAIVKTQEAHQVARVVYDTDHTTDAIKLTDALVEETLKSPNPHLDASITMRLLRDSTMLSNPLAFIEHNSQKARLYADAILNHLDGQTDEPQEDRLARRIINGRGVEASLKLARAIVVYIAGEINAPYAEIVAKMGANEPKPEIPEEERKVWGPLGAAAMMDQITAEPLSRAEPETATPAAPLFKAVRASDSEGVMAAPTPPQQKKRNADYLNGHTEGDVWIVGRTENGLCDHDNPAAIKWRVYAQIGDHTVRSEQFGTHEAAESRAADTRNAPGEDRKKVIRGINAAVLTLDDLYSFINEYLQTHERDEQTAETIQTLYHERFGVEPYISPIMKIVREIAPQKRGRKPNSRPKARGAEGPTSL